MDQLAEGESGPPDGRGERPQDGRGERAPADADELAALRRAVELQRGVARRSARQAAEAERALTTARAELRGAQARLEGLESRRAVRLALGVKRVIRAIAGRARQLRRSLPGRRQRVRSVDERRTRATAAEEARMVERLAATMPATALASGPLVSIVMLNRNGVHHLRRCLPALSRTAYRDLELVVVDNGSADGSLEVLEAWRPPFPVRVLRNSANTTFSEGNNQGIAAASGEFVLFLNNDVEPIAPGWLGCLVETAREPGVAAVGARLVYPRRSAEPRDGLRFPDLSLQHGGVHFAMDGGVPMPVPSGAGDDARAPWACAVRESPALTAACLLVRRSELDAVGGFSPGYDYGMEDVDLCLKLLARGGRLVYDGRAALWHHEGSTRALGDTAGRRARRTANRDRFAAAWAPRLYRTVMLDAIAGTGRWRLEPLRVGIDRPQTAGPDATAAAAAVGASLRAMGCDVIDADAAEDLSGVAPPLDALVAVAPDRDVRTAGDSLVRVAWIPGAPQPWLASPWLEDYDIVLAPSEEALASVARRHPGAARATAVDGDASAAPAGAAIVEALAAWVRSARVAIRVGIPSWEVAPSWGDLHFAGDLRRALRRRGRAARLQLAPAWPTWAAARDDVAIHLFGQAEAPTHPGQLNVLWHISHPDNGTPAIYARYDLAFAASDLYAAWMASETGLPVRPLHQASDPGRFRPEPAGRSHELLFVANSRGVRRHILDDLGPTDHDLAVYGRNWTPERLDPRYHAGDLIPNNELGGSYAAAAIVLNDHWPDMQREGFFSNRLYDAAAAGAFVISDAVEGLDEEFDGGVVTYCDARDLRSLVDWYLEHPEERARHAARARAAVLARHTFDDRAEAILSALTPLEALRPLGVVP